MVSVQVKPWADAESRKRMRSRERIVLYCFVLFLWYWVRTQSCTGEADTLPLEPVAQYNINCVIFPEPRGLGFNSLSANYWLWAKTGYFLSESAPISCTTGQFLTEKKQLWVFGSHQLGDERTSPGNGYEGMTSSVTQDFQPIPCTTQMHLSFTLSSV